MVPARRGPRCYAEPAILLEVEVGVVRLPASDADPGRRVTVERLAVAVERFQRAVEASGGRLLGLVDLALLASWSGGQDASSPAASGALRALSGLLADLNATGLDHAARAAMVAGTATTGSFGGLAGRWISLVTGAVSQQLTEAMAQAAPGELVVGADVPVPGLPGPTPRGEALRAVSLVSLPPAPERAESLPVPRVELTPCAVVVIDVCGLDPLRSDHPQRLHGAIRSLQRCARQHRGELLALCHDHRGLSALVRFVPSSSRPERAAVGALRFGHELAQALAEQGLDAPAAATVGTAWSWCVGEHTVLAGDAVTRAVHLAGNTPSEFLCDDGIATLGGRRARLEELRVRGGAPGDRRFVVEHVDPSRTNRWAGASGIVARLEELARLDQLVGEFLAGTTGVLLVEGELGMGKSRLVDELVARLRQEACKIVITYGVPGANAAPLFPWGAALLQVLGLEDGASPEACRELVLDRLGDPGADLAPLEHLLPLGETTQPTIAPPSGMLIERLAALLARLTAAEPLVIVLEDAQWLDSASWSLARELVSRGTELLLVAALRTDSHELQLDAQRLAAMPETSVIALRGLALSDLEVLVRQDLGVRGLSEDLLAALRLATEGNPLLCLEWLRLLQDEGLLLVEDGGLVREPSAEQLAAHPLGGVAQLVARRVALLEPALHRTLAVCAAVGGVFETSLLTDVHPDAPGSLRVEAQLERLATVGLVQPAPGRADRAWYVAHSGVVEICHDRLTPEERVALHAAVASWYEQREDDLSPLYPLLAQHWVEARRRDPALRYLELAGAQAMRTGAMPEAIRHYQQALRLTDDSGADGPLDGTLRRAHWERCLGDAHYACGDLERCAVHFDRSLTLMGHRLPRSRPRLMAYAAQQLIVQTAHRLLPGAWFEVEVGRHARLHEASHAAERLAERYYYSADAVALCSASVLSANLADRLGLRGRNARPYASMSYLIGLAGFEGLSERVYRRAVEIGEGTPDPAGLAVACFTRANLRAGQGRFDEAKDLARRAITTAEACAGWQEAGVARTMLAVCCYLQSAFGDAEAQYGDLLGLARERYNAQHEAWGLYGIGQCQLHAGRLHEAGRSVRQGLAVLRNIEDHPSRVICHGVLAAVYARQGQLEQARESADLAQALFRRVRVPFVLPVVEGISGMVEATLAVWAHAHAQGSTRDPARGRAHAAVRTLGLFGRVFPLVRPRHLTARGVLARIEGRHAQAMRDLEAAARGAERLGLPFERALAWMAWSEVPGLDPAQVATLRQDAARSFEALGCAWHLARLDQQGQSQ